MSERRHSFWGVWQYVRPLRRWIKEQRRRAHGKCVHAAAAAAAAAAAEQGPFIVPAHKLKRLLHTTRRAQSMLFHL